MKGIKTLIILGILATFLAASVPSAVSAKSLEYTDITLKKIASHAAGEQFSIRGSLVGSVDDPVMHSAFVYFLDGKHVSIYRRGGNNPDWTFITNVTTGLMGKFSLPWTEYSKGKRHYLAVFWGESPWTGSYRQVSTVIT